MNYTTNYHLPQWEETDRVLMGDFNAAMAGIELGLMEGARLDRLALDRGRDLYRQAVQHAVHHGPWGLTDSMWVNPLTSREDAGDGRVWNGRYGVITGLQTQATLAGILDSVKQVSEINTIPTATIKSYTAAIEFTPDGLGSVTRIGFWTSYYGSGEQQTLPVLLKLIRLDTNEEVCQAGPFLTVRGDRYTDYTVDFPFEAHVKYRLEYSVPADLTFWGTSGFVTGSGFEGSDDAFDLAITPRTASQTLASVVPRPDYAVGAAALVRWQEDGDVAMSINGTPMTRGRTRETVNADGTVCLETEFSMEPLPAGELTVTLDLLTQGEMTVYDYGLIWK